MVPHVQFLTTVTLSVYPYNEEDKVTEQPFRSGELHQINTKKKVIINPDNTYTIPINDGTITIEANAINLIGSPKMEELFSKVDNLQERLDKFVNYPVELDEEPEVANLTVEDIENMKSDGVVGFSDKKVYYAPEKDSQTEEQGETNEA